MDVSVGNSPKAQTPHASRSKYLGKILGNRRSEFVTNAKICHFVTGVSPKFSRGSDANTWVVCWEWSQQACPGRWAPEQLEEHTNGQNRYYLECERLLALNDTEKLWRAAKDQHRRQSRVSFQSNICGCKEALGEKVTPASLGGDNLRGVFSFANLDCLGLGYWEEPKLPGDCFSGPGCRVLRCTHRPKDPSSLVQRASSVWPQANHATSRVLQSSLTTRLWDFN